MEIKPTQKNSAFSLVEILVGVSILGVVFVALYAGFSSGFAVVQLSRENLRATQILQEKMETIRLYTWEQVNKQGFMPTNFVESFYASGTNISGLLYTGTVQVAAAPIAEDYKDDMRLVKIQVKWVSAGVERKREMQSFISHYGLQNYIY